LLILNGGYDCNISVSTVLRNTVSDLKFHVNLQGHANALRDISVNNQYNVSLIGTASQDSYVRLWTLKQLSEEEVKIFESRRKDNITIFDEYKSQTSYAFKLDEGEYYHILLESVLYDHEDTVSSVRFYENNGKVFILTSSFDFTVGLWEYTNVSSRLVLI